MTRAEMLERAAECRQRAMGLSSGCDERKAWVDAAVAYEEHAEALKTAAEAVRY